MARWRCAQVLAIVLTLSSSAYAQRRGYDITGLAMQDVGLLAGEIDTGVAIGALQGTFGDTLPALEQLVQTGKVSEVRLHILNGTCYHVSPNRCGKGDPALNDDATLSSRTAQYQAFCDRHPGLECEASPVLEYDERSVVKVQHWIDVVKKSGPRLRIVLSPSGVGAKLPGYLIESHGNSAKGDIISNDGQSLFDSDSANYCKGAKKTCFGWPGGRTNVRLGANWVMPLNRPKSWALRPQDVHQMVLVMRPQPAAPPMAVRGCTTVRNLQGKELWKSNAEEGAPPASDVRWSKSLVIWQRKSSPTLVSPAGLQVGWLRYYGTYTPYGPNWYRAYVGTGSGDTPVGLYQKNGNSEWLFLKDGGLCILVNAIRRKGTFK